MPGIGRGFVFDTSSPLIVKTICLDWSLSFLGRGRDGFCSDMCIRQLTRRFLMCAVFASSPPRPCVHALLSQIKTPWRSSRTRVNDGNREAVCESDGSLAVEMLARPLPAGYTALSIVLRRPGPCTRA